MSDFMQLMKDKTAYANEVIGKFLPQEAGYPAELFEAMNYSVSAGGKRLRPVIMNTVYRMMGGSGNEIEPFMAAMEYLHTYSLVHDDMPEIDNDDYRRGRLTTHKKYGQDHALLAGDGLLHWSMQTAMKAFDCIGQECDKAQIQQRLIEALSIFAAKSGTDGMVAGQAVDVFATGKSVEKDRLDYIYRMKTSALIEASFMLGAVLAGANKEDVDRCETIGYNVGMAFQIKDDILDCTGDEAVIGKPVGSDEKNQKTTYVTLFGLENAQKKVEEMSEAAIRDIDLLESADNDEKEFLIWLVGSLIDRNN